MPASGTSNFAYNSSAQDLTSTSLIGSRKVLVSLSWFRMYVTSSRILRL